MSEDMIADKKDQKEPMWTKNFLLIIAGNFLLFTSFQMLLPTLPVYAESLGGGELVVGLIIGIFTVAAVLVRPYAGMIMDRQGRRGVLTVGLIFFVLAVFLYNYTYSIFLLLVLRVLHGFSWGAATTASGTVAADVIPATRRGEGMGFYGMSNTLSMAFAPALGLLVMASYGFTSLFVIATVLGALALGIVQLIQYQPVVQQNTGVKPAMIETTSFRPGSVLFFTTFIYGGIVTFIALYSMSLGLASPAAFFTIYALVLLVTRPIAGKIMDKRGADIVIVPGLLLVVAGATVLGLAQGQAQPQSFFIASSILMGLGFGAVQPSLQALTIMMAPPERRGAANATFFSAFDLGIGAGAVLLGFSSTWVGYGNMFLMSSFSGLVALGLYWYLLGGDKKSRKV